MLIVNPPYTNRRGGVRLGQTPMNFTQQTPDLNSRINPIALYDYFSSFSPTVDPSKFGACSPYIPATWLASRYRDLLSAMSGKPENYKSGTDYSYGKYQIEAESIIRDAIEYSKYLVNEWNNKAGVFSSKPAEYQAVVMRNFLFEPEVVGNVDTYPVRAAVRLAAGFVGASRPDLVKSLVNAAPAYRDLELSKVDIQVPGAKSGITYKNLLIDATIGSVLNPERANPYFNLASVGYVKWDDLIYRVALLAAAIIRYVDDPSKLAPVGFIKATIPPALLSAGFKPEFYNWACSFDPYIVVDPSNRTPPWVLKSVSDADRANAERNAAAEAITNAQLQSVAEDKRLYTYAQLTAAKDAALVNAQSTSVAENSRLYTYAQLTAAKNAALQECPLTTADQEKIDTEVTEAIQSRQLKTPAEVAAAVKVESDKLEAANKKLEEEKSNKMLMVAGAAVAGVILGFAIFKK
jgi:hypothetical protein